MTAVNSAAKMVGHLRRWLTGEEVTADSPCVENVSGHCSCSTCTCNSVASSQFVYRGRSYSDCCSTSCRSGHRDPEARERSCSVSSRRTTSHGWRRLGLHTYHTSSGSAWSSDRRSSVHAVLEEDRELCRCCEPVCCCERCFVYVDDHPPLLPPPYGKLLLGRGTDLAAKLINNEPSITADTADVTDQVTIVAEAGDSRTSLSTKPFPSATGQLDDTSKESEASSSRHAVTSLTQCLPPSVHASFDGEDGYANSQQHLRWARRQRLIDDALTATACPPPNRTICHVVDCW